MPAKIKSTQTKTEKKKSADSIAVANYLTKLKAPLLKDVNILRNIITSCDDTIKERIKWNAPSYYTTEDFLTFNLRNGEYILLIFHHPSIVKIKSPILEGEYKDRRIVYLTNSKEVAAVKSELKIIIPELLKLMKKQKLING